MREYFFQESGPRGMELLFERDPNTRREAEMPPPATPEAVRSAEDAVGFRFPPLLMRLWTEVANGGIRLQTGGILPFDGPPSRHAVKLAKREQGRHVPVAGVGVAAEEDAAAAEDAVGPGLFEVREPGVGHRLAELRTVRRHAVVLDRQRQGAGIHEVCLRGERRERHQRQREHREASGHSE